MAGLLQEHTEGYEDFMSDIGYDLPSYFGRKILKDTRKPCRVVKGQVYFRCTRCGQYLSKSDYYKDNRNPNGICNKCKKCYHVKA